jgi:hypothetical protein
MLVDLARSAAAHTVVHHSGVPDRGGLPALHPLTHHYTAHHEKKKYNTNG